MKLQMVLYVVVLLLAYCDQEQIPVVALVCKWSSQFWYGLAEFAGQIGMASERMYWEEVKTYG